MSLTWRCREIPPDGQYRTIVLKRLSGLLLFLLTVTTANANQDLAGNIHLLDKEFQQLSTRFFQDTAKSYSADDESLQSISALEEKVTQLAQGKQSVEAILLLYRHVELINNNLDHDSINHFLSLLLEHNELNLANRLFKTIQNEGDDFQIARSKFIFAKYYADQLAWTEVKKYLEKVPQELSAQNSAYALLLQGIALQQLKQHRQAQDSYQKIPPSSQYYRHARLNLAIAHIRQGWLTSARTTISELISSSEKNNPDEFTNRLYLVLGYALLQRDYYRSARESFRNISLDSLYINRALLGIAMCVTNMGEFENALNTLSLLKAKKTTDLSTEESYLLIPYVYEKLGQQVDVATSYTEAMAHYQNRINDLKTIPNQHQTSSMTLINDDATHFNISGHEFEFGKRFPGAFINNYRQLMAFSAINKNQKFDAPIEELLHKHKQLFQQLIAQLVNQKIDQLDSYLSQARFGLARLYDKSKQEAE